MGTSQLSSTISSAKSLLCTSCSPGLPSTSVNTSDCTAVLALLVSAYLDVSNIHSTQHLYHVLKNDSAATAIFFVTGFDQSLELPSTGTAGSAKQQQALPSHHSLSANPQVRLDQNWGRFYRDFNQDITTSFSLQFWKDKMSEVKIHVFDGFLVTFFCLCFPGLWNILTAFSQAFLYCHKVWKSTDKRHTKEELRFFSDTGTHAARDWEKNNK